MDREQMRQRLMQTFLEELEDHAQHLKHALSQWETIADSAERATLRREIFRIVHSLKGDARAVDIALLATVCHELEARLAATQHEPASFSPAFRSLLFELVDALQQMAERLRTGTSLEGSRLALLLSRLQQPGSAAEDATPTTSRTLPVTDVDASAEAVPELPPLPTSVRLPAQKLDALLQSVAELSGVRTRPQARREHLETIREMTDRLRNRLLTRTLRPLRTTVQNADRGLAQSTAHATARPVAVSHERPGHIADDPVLRAALFQIEKELEELHRALIADELAMDKAVALLQEEVQSARLVPLSESLTGFERIVEDLARRCGKTVQLQMHGVELELDRYLVQHLKEPLLHLVRNAVDHGIELPHERTEQGKAATGIVSCSAQLVGDRVLVEVGDDGRGIDWDKLREVARQRGLGGVEQLGSHELIFGYGLSTAARVTEVSGRGVGLDVARARIEALRGDISVASQQGQGTRFILSVPLDISVRRVLLVRVGGQLMALDQASVAQVTRLSAEDRRQVAGRPGFAWNDELLPLVGLAPLFGFPEAESVHSSVAERVVIVSAANRRAAFLVDGFEGSDEVTVQTLGPRLRKLPFVQGTFTLPSGPVVLLLDSVQLMGESGRTAASASIMKAPTVKREQPKRLLVADDSRTTRTLEKTILEAAGFEVLTAADGQQAWDILQSQGADLLVTDVEMPLLDGFQLTEAVRSSKRFGQLPVILLTARHSKQDQRRGLELGADAYLVKSAFDQRLLLATIAQLL